MKKKQLRERIAALELELFEARQAAFSEALRRADSNTITGGPVTTGFTVRCTCPPNRGSHYVGNCPIHDTQVSYSYVMPQ